MKSTTIAKGLAVLAVLVPATLAHAGDRSQLVAGARLDGAAEMTLDELHVAKINRSASNDNRVASPVAAGPATAGSRGQLAAAAGIATGDAGQASLDAIFAMKINRSASFDNRTTVPGEGGGSYVARSGQAFVGTDEPSLDEIFRRKINRSAGFDDRQELPY